MQIGEHGGGAAARACDAGPADHFPDHDPGDHHAHPDQVVIRTGVVA